MSFWSTFILGNVVGIVGFLGLLYMGAWLMKRSDVPPTETPASTGLEQDPQLDIDLHERDVPKELRAMVPIARKFGVGCDGLRMGVIEAATAHEISELRNAIRRHGWVIEKWISYTPPNMPEWLVPMMYALLASEEISPPLLRNEWDEH